MFETHWQAVCEHCKRNNTNCAVGETAYLNAEGELERRPTCWSCRKPLSEKRERAAKKPKASSTNRTKSGT